MMISGLSGHNIPMLCGSAYKPSHTSVHIYVRIYMYIRVVGDFEGLQELGLLLGIPAAARLLPDLAWTIIANLTIAGCQLKLDVHGLYMYHQCC